MKAFVSTVSRLVFAMKGRSLVNVLDTSFVQLSSNSAACIGETGLSCIRKWRKFRRCSSLLINSPIITAILHPEVDCKSLHAFKAKYKCRKCNDLL